ncbi:MAG: DNA translocase FtsK 4TM domain-containing protein, partial [Glaciimonas sp.]|nr:DNA translocase FtsK 4TM domain-containing protein [Glaciimonas sp.]
MNRTTQAYNRGAKPKTALLPKNRLVRLLSEARWIIFTVVTTYLMIIFISYSKADPGWSHSRAGPNLDNWGGWLGAYVADLLLFVFGASAWWWCVLLLRSVWRGYQHISQWLVVKTDPEDTHPHEVLIRGIGFGLILIGSMGIEYMRMYSIPMQLPRAPGGVLGQLIGSNAQSTLGFTGATLLLLSFFALGVSLFFHVSWLTVAERIGQGIEGAIQWVRNLIAAREDRRVGFAASVKREEIV